MKKHLALFMLVFALAACQGAAPGETATVEPIFPTETITVDLTNTPTPTAPSATAESTVITSPTATEAPTMGPKDVALSPQEEKQFGDLGITLDKYGLQRESNGAIIVTNKITHEVMYSKNGQ
jgi:hypothetical protein